MRVRDVMTVDPACCRPDTPVPQVARLMCNNDCGAIPVVDASGMPLGVVTDRDIACRVVAQGLDARRAIARDCMSAPTVAVTVDMSLEDCCATLERNQIRRVLVLDEQGACCGIVAQADVVRSASPEKAGAVVREVSRQGPSTPVASV